MAKLYFNYGVMGSSKSANALMTHFNYQERGQKPLMVKPRRDTRDAEKIVSSRIGLKCPCVYFDELQGYDDKDIQIYDCIIVDEVQFLESEDIDYLVHIVDDLNIPVVCYGLRTDFKGDLFPGSKRLFEMADRINEVKTVCWCGRKAIMNARFDSNGKVLKVGEQVQIGANECYTGLCRKHWREGNLGVSHYKSESETIREVILNMPSYFNLSDLYYILKKEYDIVNRLNIRRIVDELCESEAIEYEPINNDEWAFRVKR